METTIQVMQETEAEVTVLCGVIQAVQFAECFIEDVVSVLEGMAVHDNRWDL